MIARRVTDLIVRGEDPAMGLLGLLPHKGNIAAEKVDLESVYFQPGATVYPRPPLAGATTAASSLGSATLRTKSSIPGTLIDCS